MIQRGDAQVDVAQQVVVGGVAEGLGALVVDECAVGVSQFIVHGAVVDGSACTGVAVHASAVQPAVGIGDERQVGAVGGVGLVVGLDGVDGGARFLLGHAAMAA